MSKSQACFPSPVQQHPRAELGRETGKKGDGLPEPLLWGVMAAPGYQWERLRLGLRRAQEHQELE